MWALDVKLALECLSLVFWLLGMGVFGFNLCDVCERRRRGKNERDEKGVELEGGADLRARARTDGRDPAESKGYVV